MPLNKSHVERGGPRKTNGMRLFPPLLILLTAIAASPANALDVIANPNVPQSEISTHALRAIFSMRLREWNDGSPVTVFVLSEDDKRHIEFCNKLLQILPRTLERNWDHLVFSGTGQRPITVSSEQDLKRRVAETPGAIGYLEAKDLVDDHVKMLSVRR